MRKKLLLIFARIMAYDIYEVEVSEQADSDLRGIFEYIAFLRVMYAGRNIDNQLNLHTKQ